MYLGYPASFCSASDEVRHIDSEVGLNFNTVYIWIPNHEMV